MTIGSAASLRRDQRGTLPPSFHSLRQPLAEPATEGASPRWPVKALAASEPPRGRILLVEHQAVIALDLQRLLRDAGYRAIGPATSVADVRALMARGTIDGAVLDLDGLGDSASAIADVLAASAVPFVFLASGRDRVPVGHAGRPVIDKPYAAGELLSALDKAMAEDDEPDILYPVVSGPVSWPRVMPQL
jgi:CheY-like chemotaxis protein